MGKLRVGTVNSGTQCHANEIQLLRSPASFMSLVLANYPDQKGLAAFLAACNCSAETFNKTTGFHHVLIHGVALRITEDQEYLVEQDLFVARLSVGIAARSSMSAATSRIRVACASGQVISPVGSRRLESYRRMRKDDSALLYVSRSRRLGGTTPPTVVAISASRYMVHHIGLVGLGLNSRNDFVTLLNGIETLPECPIAERLYNGFARLPVSAPAAAARAAVLTILEEIRDEANDSADAEAQVGVAVVVEDNVPSQEICADLISQRDQSVAELKAFKEQQKTTIRNAQRRFDRMVKTEQERSKLLLDETQKNIDVLKEEMVKLELSSTRLEERAVGSEEIRRVLSSRLETIERELRETTDRRILLANPSRCGAYAEKRCGPRIASAFTEFGRTVKTAGIESHSTDFIQESSPWFLIAHELKFGETVVSSKDGIDKLRFDIEHLETTQGCPVLAATLISWRSNVATMSETAISSQLASNGHTLIVCVNNVQKQSGSGGDDPVLRTAYEMIKHHIERVANEIYSISSTIIRTYGYEREQMADIVFRSTGAQVESRANKFVVDTIEKYKRTSEDGTEFLENICKEMMDTKMTIVLCRPGRTFVRESVRSRSVARHWDTSRPPSPTRTAMVDDTELHIAEAVANDFGVQAEAIDLQRGTVARAEIDHSTGDAIASIVSDDGSIGMIFRDGVTGAMVSKSKDVLSGIVTEYVHYNHRVTECVGGIEVPRYIPQEWHTLFDVKKAWGPVDRQIAEALMTCHKQEHGAEIGRSDVKKNLVGLLPMSSIGTAFYAHLGFILNENNFTTGKGGVVKGIRSKKETE